MNLWEVVFDLKSGSALIEISKTFPQNDFVMWYVWNRQLLKFNFSDESELSRIREILTANDCEVLEEQILERRAVLLLRVKNSDSVDVWDISYERNCLELPPAVFQNGAGRFRFVGFKEQDIKALLEDVRRNAEVEIIRKKKLPLNVIRSSLWINSMLTGFTPRQAECLIAAQSMGYYNSPRKTTTGKVAARVGVTRSTFETHLRKSENIVMNSFVPYLKLFNLEKDESDFHHRTLEATLVDA